ncbi:MAG: hypothetical protein GXY50_07340 [Syntrophomonadaceae bacterium]|nr:hypothetical protein [Syntrophomonadaceae bacterium]
MFISRIHNHPIAVWWYPQVTEAGQKFTAIVVWNEASTQEFKVIIGEGVSLEAAPVEETYSDYTISTTAPEAVNVDQAVEFTVNSSLVLNQ